MKGCYGGLLLLFFFCIACQQKKPVQTTTLPRPVRVVQVEALGRIIRQFTGVVEATEFSILAFKVPGTLTAMNVTEGQQLRKGQVIARIKPDDYQLKYETALANYQAARSIYERSKNLVASDAVSRENLEIAEADFVRATSAVNISRRTLGYTILKAPFDGFIEKRYVDNYEEILSGQAIVKLVNPDSIEIHFILPETSIQLLQIPRKIFVEFDSQPGKVFTSDIKEYIYASDGSGIPITLIITDEEFAKYQKNVFPGFSCKVTWEIDNMISDKFIIPSNALAEENGKEYVWTIRPGTHTAHRHEIKTLRLGKNILVESGLQSEDLIVIAGLSSLKEGEQVRPVSE